VIAAHARPRLASKARLRFDRHERRHVLLYPERGMLLNASAAAIAALCTGEHTVDAIVERLHAANGGANRGDIERDVQTFLSALLDRSLVQFDD
jgi:pyrroloquinoline quinone biosynthesis protein D